MNKGLIITGVLLWTASAFSQAPIASWPFNNHANDVSGNRNNGSIRGNISPTTDRFGNPCGAYHFDGVSAYIEVPNSPTLESPATACTITAWYKLDQARPNQWLTVLCKGNSNNEQPDNPQYRLQVQQNTTIGLSTCSPYSPSGSSTISINTEFTECDMNFSSHLLEDGKWNFYALVYDGQKVVTYMNSQKVFEFAYSGVLYKNNSPLYIGFDEPGNGEYYEGSLDDVNLYNTALGEKDILAIFRTRGSSGNVSSQEEFEISTPANKEVILLPTACNTIVSFDPPQLTKTSCVNVSIRQVSGLAPGSIFSPGRHLITYEAVSASGYEQRCSFYIIVKDITAPELLVPRDTAVMIKQSEPGFKYNYKQPESRDACGIKSTTLVSGSKAGDLLAPGKHKIRYRVTDVNGNNTEKEFAIEVRQDTFIVVTPATPITTVVPPPPPPSLVSTDTTGKNQPTANPTIKRSDTTLSPTTTILPSDLNKRTREEQNLIEVENDVLTGKLYDNGVYDKDTVTIILNQQTILQKREISDREQQFTIAIDTTRDNELIMYADNLGEIPPNTALLILYDGTTRYEINLLSSMSTNGVIRIRKRKK